MQYAVCVFPCSCARHTRAHVLAHMQVCAEIQGGLDEWEKSGRWGKVGIVDQVKSNTHLKWAY